MAVRGGSGGIAARTEQLREMAACFGAVAGESLSAALGLHGYLAHPALVLSALLDPIGFADFEATLLAALDAPQGLSWAGAEAGVIDGELRAAASAYEAVDDTVATLRDDILGLARLPEALAEGAATLAHTGDPLQAAQAAIAADPQAADLVVELLGLPAALTAAAGALADGVGVVRRTGADAGALAATPPRRLTDVLADLARRNDDPRHGEIDVRVLTGPGGARRAIVDITGTKSWTLAPTHDITSLTTNCRALVGERTAYEQGVLAAMTQAGVRPGDPVMLVGHSEGGMVAVTAARDAVASGQFNVTHVVTAGAPIGRTAGQLPRGVQVLALENRADVVPHLDGVANPDLPNVTTVAGTRGDGTVLGDHGVRSTYLPLAGDAQASGARSVRDFLGSAHAYFSATEVRTHTYQIRRE